MKTCRPLVLFSVFYVLSGFVFSGAAIAFQEIEVSVVGLSIAKKDTTSEYGGAMVSGLRSGTTIYINARLPGRTVIEIKRNEKKEFKISDSTGEALPSAKLDFGFMADISDDGQAVQLPIASDKVPTEGAESINIMGSVTLVCGAEPIQEEVDVEIASGKKFKLAGIEFKVADIQKSFMNDDGQMIELQCSASPAQIQSITAILADGKSVKLTASGKSEFGFGDNVTYGRNFDVVCKAADIKKLKVSYFKSVEEIELPIELKVGLGF